MLLASPRAQKELDALPSRIADGLRQLLGALAEDPRSKRFDLKPLVGGRGKLPRLRLRIGDYLVILEIDHARQQILVGRVGHRSTIYRDWGGGD